MILLFLLVKRKKTEIRIFFSCFQIDNYPNTALVIETFGMCRLICLFSSIDFYNSGRRITSSGQRDLDQVAGRISVAP